MDASKLRTTFDWWQDYIQPRMLDIRGIVTAMPPSKTPTSDTVELVGALRLPLGGVNGYKHVRGIAASKAVRRTCSRARLRASRGARHSLVQLAKLS